MRMIRCPVCKRMYEFDGLNRECCPDCAVNAEREYRIVREYVKQRPGVKLGDVSTQLGVPYTKVIQYLREERLEIARVSESFLRCDKCAAVITTGVRCDACKKKFGYD